jgi:hypothetical protein
MNQRVLRCSVPILWLVLLVAIAGCSKNSPTAPASSSSVTAQVNATLAAAVDLVDDGMAEDGTQYPTSLVAGGATPMAAVRPFTWWQNVTAETRQWSFAFSDSDATGPNTCIATLTKHMTGFFVIVPPNPADTTQPSTTRIRKPLDKTLTRRVLLERVTIGAQKEWKVVQITGALVSTQAVTTHILSVRLQSTSGVDTTITDPLAWHALRHITRFATSDTVTVTVTTSRTDDVVYIHRWDWRHRLRSNGDGTYSFTWVTSAWGGWRHMGLQAMTHGSLFDDTLPYDSQAWHLPFRVSQPDVDFFPPT